jgi:hypothetical protein
MCPVAASGANSTLTIIVSRTSSSKTNRFNDKTPATFGGFSLDNQVTPLVTLASFTISRILLD